MWHSCLDLSTNILLPDCPRLLFNIQKIVNVLKNHIFTLRTNVKKFFRRYITFIYIYQTDMIYIEVKRWLNVSLKSLKPLLKITENNIPELSPLCYNDVTTLILLTYAHLSPLCPVLVAGDYRKPSSI